MGQYLKKPIWNRVKMSLKVCLYARLQEPSLFYVSLYFFWHGMINRFFLRHLPFC
jgi:hypothetical protein